MFLVYTNLFIKCGLIFLKNGEVFLEQIFVRFFTKKLILGTRKMENDYAEICLFHERWIKVFDTQPLGKLYIKYGLIFYKIDLIQFCNKYMVDPSQKNSFWAFKKWKMNFSSKENEKSLRKHCLSF